MSLYPNFKDNNICIGVVLFVCLILCAYSGQNSCPKNGQQFLVTFHPHLDAFWLNTDDQLKNINFKPAGFLYAMNQRNSKQIYNSMYNALIQDEKRKYFVTEIVFFKDWYQYLDENKRQQVKKMLKNGQLDVANSGWVQNDQAVCYYDDILDQYTIGMNWMYQQFGYVNKIGWSTDSFGHSHSQVALQHLLGFQFQGIQRIDDRYIYQRKQKPLLQFYWQPVSDSNGRKYGGVLNHVRHFLHQVNDLRRTSLSSITRDFQSLQQNMLKLYGKNKMFRFLGNDFQQFIPAQFSTLEQSFSQLNKNTNPQCPKYKYGNPKDYLQIIKPYWSQNSIETRQKDFMPNWDQDRYWSGYFTTDPDLKIICKSFSRLVNLVRKVMLKSHLSDRTVFQTHQQPLQRAQQLLSIMQHHDGITATSKSYIQKLFKDRMANSSKQLVQIVEKVDKIQSPEVCKLFQSRNTCNLTQKQPKLTLSILHEGIPRKQKIQLILPQGWIYTIEGIQSFVIMHPLKYATLVFQVQLKPGKNDVVLIGVQNSHYKGEFKQYEDNEIFNNNEGIKVQIKDNNQIKYSFGQNYMHFSLQTSPNNPSRRQTMSWNKYGQKTDKTQTVIPGIYIMSNDGNLSILNPNFFTIKVVQFGNWYRLFFDGDKVDVTLTFKRDDPSQVDYDLVFTPNGYKHFDYFLKIQSNVANKQNQFYHDSNGYLVAKRKIGSRPDYDWTYKKQDKINANTYPACSFFYQKNEQEKFIAFVDRALGITTYDGNMLINIDRLAADDYKGVGQGYSFIRQNRFNFKFAITSKQDDIQRVWQRAYDDSLLAFITDQDPVRNQPNLRKTPDNPEHYLKYNVYFLNKNEVLIRIHNLAENKDLTLNHFGQKSWIIPEVSLNITYSSIRQSFANGIILKERYNWVGDKEQINQMTRGTSDSKQSIVLRPLQIRSYRINLDSQIVDKQFSSIVLNQQATNKIQADPHQTNQVKHVVKRSLRKKCF